MTLDSDKCVKKGIWGEKVVTLKCPNYRINQYMIKNTHDVMSNGSLVVFLTNIELVGISFIFD